MLKIRRSHKITIEESSDGGSFFDVFKSEKSKKESDLESIDSNKISIGDRKFNYRFKQRDALREIKSFRAEEGKCDWTLEDEKRRYQERVSNRKLNEAEISK